MLNQILSGYADKNGTAPRQVPTDFKSMNFDYKYPRGLELKPVDQYHNALVSEITSRAKAAADLVRMRRGAWEKLDWTLSAFIPIDDYERKIKLKDTRKPVSIVIPVTKAILDTHLTHLIAAFGDDPIFRYAGVGGEDELGSMLLEQVVAHQAAAQNHLLSLHTMFRDDLVYGFGAVSPQWVVEKGRVVRRKREGYTNLATGEFVEESAKTTTATEITFEGNRLYNIDPYLILPDPNVPLYRMQDGEFIGWIESTNYPALLAAEHDGGQDYFNVQYLQAKGSFETALLKDDVGRALWRTDQTRAQGMASSPYDTKAAGVVSGTTPIDVIHLAVNLIPSMWGLGSSQYPEKWLFSVAGDQVCIRCKRMTENHQMLPVAVAASNYDGYSALPISQLEVVYGMQEAIDWLWNSRVKNVRKTMHNRIVGDPSQIMWSDVVSPEAGQAIRMKPNAYGKDIRSMIFPMPFEDVTQSHIGDAIFMLDQAMRISGAVDSLQGVMRAGGERRSATEARDTRLSALGRMERQARVISEMAIRSIAKMLAHNTVQYSSKDILVKIIGDREEKLRELYGKEATNAIKNGRVSASPDQLAVNWDVQSRDSTNALGENSQGWIQFFQVLSTNPQLAGQFDMLRVAQMVARSLGLKNFQDFRAKGGQLETMIAGNAEVEAGVQAGNLIPAAELGADGAAAGRASGLPNF